MEALFSFVWLLAYALPTSAQIQSDLLRSDVDSRHVACGVQQNGFHVNLHCELLGAPQPKWDDCVLKIRLSRAFYVDPYELALRQPGVNFTLSKPKSKFDRSSVFGRWLSWFSGSASDTDALSDLPEVPMNQSEVDVEAPVWLAESMTLRFHPNATGKASKSGRLALDIPVHIRYRLPRDDDQSLEKTPLAHPIVKCDDGYEYNTWNSVPPFDLSVPVPPTSDLLYVMPVTILLLTVGVIVLLIA